MNAYKLTIIVKRITGTYRQDYTYIADDMFSVLHKFYTSPPQDDGIFKYIEHLELLAQNVIMADSLEEQNTPTKEANP